jgi:hypothetical protein
MAQKSEVVTSVDVLNTEGELSEAERNLLARAQAATLLPLQFTKDHLMD